MTQSVLSPLGFSPTNFQRQADSVNVQNGWSGETLRRSGSDTLYTGVLRAVVPSGWPLWA
jgi:hypothetical protein